MAVFQSQALASGEAGWLFQVIAGLRAEREALAAALRAGEVSDGYHTHNELYRYRMLLHAYATQSWIDRGLPVVKSWRHHDGEPCFGGGWFIVVAQIPTGQVSCHYRARDWDLFAAPAVDRAPVWDGHSPAQAAERLAADLTDTVAEKHT